MERVLIRQATARDEPAIRACARAAFAPYIAAIGRPPAPMTADHGRAVAAGEAWVASGPDGDFLGFAILRDGADHLLLDTVAVRPEHQGAGVGRALLAACEDMARARGFGAIRLYTNARMTGNLALYPRLGYLETGRRVEDGFDRVHFEKRLA